MPQGLLSVTVSKFTYKLNLRINFEPLSSVQFCARSVYADTVLNNAKHILNETEEKMGVER